jgi:hypothetical protein
MFQKIIKFIHEYIHMSWIVVRNFGKKLCCILSYMNFFAVYRDSFCLKFVFLYVHDATYFRLKFEPCLQKIPMYVYI